MAEWIAFLVLSALAAYFSVAAVLGSIAMAGLSGNAWCLLIGLLPGSVAALLIWAAFQVAPFSIVIAS